MVVGVCRLLRVVCSLLLAAACLPVVCRAWLAVCFALWVVYCVLCCEMYLSCWLVIVVRGLVCFVWWLCLLLFVDCVMSVLVYIRCVCLLYVVWWLMLDDCRLLFALGCVVRRVMSVGRCAMCVVGCCWLLVVCCMMCVVWWVLFVVCCVVFGVVCPRRVDCRLLIVVWRMCWLMRVVVC